LQDHAQLVAVVLDLDVGLAEHREQVAGTGLLQFLAHHQVGVHPDQQHRHPAQPALGGDVGEAIFRGHILVAGPQNRRVEREREHAQQIQVAGPVGLPRRVLDERRSDRPVLRPNREPNPPRSPLGRVLPLPDGLDVGPRIGLDRIERQPFLLPAVLDARGPKVRQDRLLERRVVADTGVNFIGVECARAVHSTTGECQRPVR